ncbi:hypothetical protein SLEP1_g4589 [Rubroshorea leprosula]|uniref:AIPP2-like SPOC-like domain-containing protein n=1 Tax=Rubroshorea leprosula TaxID=152421 RepID=A0AAV5HWX6_9ROSI|nr:hypothetical protein SLEP1_g4589 [Rubroshorea leprosula]
MSTVCQKCGDRGFIDALTYCIVCRVCAEHRYCFDILPKVLNKDVIWVCEDCSSSVCESSSPISSSHTPEVNDEKLCIKTQTVQSKPKRLLKRTQSLQAENVCRTFELLKSVPQDDEKGLPLKEPQPNSQVHAQPILDPIWRGSMIIQNRNWTLNGLTAHLSNLACSKVSDVTSSLPNLLTLEILPRLVVWPKRFGSMASQDGDIALYFFPENESDEKAFDNLVDDMMLKDLAVKTSIGNADLLIFTSLQLPLQHWRFQRKYYLWGLFSREKFSKSTLKGSPCSR